MLETIMPVTGKVSHQGKEEKGKKGRERNANVTCEERNMEESEYGPERNATENEFSGGSWGVNFTVGEEEVPSDPDWGEIENFGADSEVGQFLRNNEDTQGYGNLQEASDVGVYKISAKEQIARCRNEKRRSFRKFNKK